MHGKEHDEVSHILTLLNLFLYLKLIIIIKKH